MQVGEEVNNSSCKVKFLRNNLLGTEERKSNKTS